MSRSINLTVFRLMLPQDGTHRELISRARAAGLPFELADGDHAVQMCQGTDDKPALGYVIDLPDAQDLGRVAERIGVCARLAQGGYGFVPNVPPLPIASLRGESDREKLARVRDLLRACSDAMEALLEATRS